VILNQKTLTKVNSTNSSSKKGKAISALTIFLWMNQTRIQQVFLIWWNHLNLLPISTKYGTNIIHTSIDMNHLMTLLTSVLRWILIFTSEASLIMKLGLFSLNQIKLSIWIPWKRMIWIINPLVFRLKEVRDWKLQERDHKTWVILKNLWRRIPKEQKVTLTIQWNPINKINSG